MARSAGKDQEARDSLDGSANSPYADALLSVLKEPNLPITETFRKISLLFQPSNASLPKKDRQQPDYTTNAGGTFYFYPTITTYNEEKTQWDRINPDKGEGQYSAFLAGYPAGYFAANARQKTTLTEQLRKLARSATQVEVVPGSLRVREEPNGTVSGNVEKGAHLTALNYSTENPWVLVKKGDSQEGYVSSQFIKPVKTINKRVSLTYEPTSTAPPAQFGRFIRGLKPEDVHRIKVTAHADDESRVGKAVSRLIELQRSFQEIKVPSFKIEPLIKTFPTQGQVNRIDVVATVTSSVEQIMQAAPPKELKPR